jgi:8-oxo-dGTP diphosphatase
MRKAARMIVQDDQGRFLLVHTTKEERNRWEFPGGKVNEGEQPADAAVRECKEETGIETKDILQVCNREIRIDNDEWQVYFFVANQHSGDISLREPDKADEVTWVLHSEIDGLPQIPRLLSDIVRTLIVIRTLLR